MNEELVTELTKALKESHSFFASQAPETVQQYLGYSFSSAIGWVVLCSLSLCVCLLVIHWTRKRGWGEPEYGFSGMLAGMVALVSFFCLFVNLVTAIQISVYPKGYMLSELTSHHGK